MRTLSHPNQRKANEALAAHLAGLHADSTLGDVSRQWQLTLYFYQAVHQVEEQLEKKGYSPSHSHAKRNKTLVHVWNGSHPIAVKA